MGFPEIVHLQNATAHLLRPLVLSSSYWRVTLASGRIVSEWSLFPLQGGRDADWTLDLLTTGDILKVRELTLVCPGFKVGQLAITEPGTAFQFKTASVFAQDGRMDKRIEAQVIGRVDDKERGTCTCWIWDRLLGLIPYHSNIFAFGSWREGIASIGALSQDVVGVRL
jgi:hypothetical protein